MPEVQKNILDKFEKIDSLLYIRKGDTSLYHTIFSIRTKYCVQFELLKHQKKTGLYLYLKKIITTGILLFTYPFIETKILNQSEVVILEGYARFDNVLSQKLDIPILKTKKSISFIGIQSRLHSLCLALSHLWKILFLKLDIKGIIYCTPDIINFWYYYKTISFTKVRVIIGEDDISPVPYAFLLNAQKNNIIRVKIEYVQIDSIVHNNVFADYYFYPTTYHLKIRKKSDFNSHLKYVEGGYLVPRKVITDLEIKNKKNVITITYFTSHGKVFKNTDDFYINEILSVMPDESILNIKIHPLDKNNYNIFKSDNRVKIFAYEQIENYQLIANSHMCFSIFSMMSFEAKETCEKSFFINYNIEDSTYKDDYDFINNFFDIIIDKKSLCNVFHKNYHPVDITTFKNNVNITGAETFKIFHNFINSLLQ